MSKTFGGSEANQQLFLGHPVGLFVLFFTEMWERFSYYGMRAILVLFLTATLMDGGWEWSSEMALSILGTYASLVYLTPILGGYIADKIIGYRWAVVIGASIMTLGHASMALETPTFLYLGLACLVIGNGFFKPNMTSIISQMYEHYPEKKDGAYTIFYMGVNSGAFLGIMLCGYLGEKVGWSYGFGLAGVFMFMGMLQFYFAQNIYGEIGKVPDKTNEDNFVETGDTDKRVPFSMWQQILIGIMTLMGLVWVFNDPYSKISGNNLLGENADTVIIIAVLLFTGLVGYRLTQYSPVVRDRLIAVVVFSFFTVFFWAAFEQAAGSMTLFARDYTSRALEGNAAITFKIVNTLLTVIPLGIITWVLFELFRRTFGHYPLSNIILGSSFVIIWGIVIWMLNREFANDNTEVAASWFGILNSLFIITFAPMISKIWESKYNPSGSVKYAWGLILLGVGFGALAFGASTIPQGAKAASVSMVWLILAYLFHTLGELCLSPVGLSYVSKLVPGRMIAFMFGIYYLAIAIGNKLAHSIGGQIDNITAQYSLSTFFLIFTIVPAIGGVILIVINPLMKRLMHGVY